MSTGITGRIVIGLSVCLALSACEDGQGPKFLQGKSGATTTQTAANSSTKTVERDTEAPEVFQVSDKGLWDGRPSLGGVWVAHPDARDPERVIIRNQSNSKFVIGVLYRPERQTPGPAIQVSSDGAEALGMLAGKPADLSITALRREEVATPPPTSGAGDDPENAPTAPLAEPDSIKATSLDPIAAASAALDQAEGKPTPKPAASAPKPAAPKPSSNSGLSKSYIQIGIFSVQANANNTAEALRRAGMVPTIKPGKSSGKEFWRVIVGPAATSAERAQLLKKIKGLGFNDAYYVTN